jgi:hypothetical protein
MFHKPFPLAFSCWPDTHLHVASMRLPSRAKSVAGELKRRKVVESNDPRSTLSAAAAAAAAAADAARARGSAPAG